MAAASLIRPWRNLPVLGKSSGLRDRRRFIGALLFGLVTAARDDKGNRGNRTKQRHEKECRLEPPGVGEQAGNEGAQSEPKQILE